MPRITAVISFCSNDWRFLKRCIDGVTPFSHQVLITVCDHFFDGSLENYALLEEAFRRFPNCSFIEFCFDPSRSYRPFSPLFPEHCNWRHEWHNTGRWLSYLLAGTKTDFFLFLDCDEIVDPSSFSQWLSSVAIHTLSACRFSCYSYFRDARFEATTHADFSLLAKRVKLRSEHLWDEDERFGIFQRISGEKRLGVKGCDAKPMIRHFSGVRTKEEFQKKLSTWGHHWERDWEDLLNEEYSRPFNGKDFIRRYSYQVVEAAFDPLNETPPLLSKIDLQEHLKGLHRFQNVVRITPQEAFKMDLENGFSVPYCNDH
jgi:hypothetical protein